MVNHEVRSFTNILDEEEVEELTVLLKLPPRHRDQNYIVTATATATAAAAVD